MRCEPEIRRDLLRVTKTMVLPCKASERQAPSPGTHGLFGELAYLADTDPSVIRSTDSARVPQNTSVWACTAPRTEESARSSLERGQRVESTALALTGLAPGLTA